MFDRLIRYLPILDYIRKYKPGRILEVGSGAKGLGEFCKAEFVGVDVGLEENPIHNMTYVQRNISDLPFDDASFDLVICLDVLEHLKLEEREKAVEEMRRVCFQNQKSKIKNQKYNAKIKNKVIIIGFPYGERAEKLSKNMLQWFKKRNSPAERWFREHTEFGLPNFEFPARSGAGAIQNSKFKIKELNNENILICEWLLKLEDYGRFLKLEKFLFTHFRMAAEFVLRRVNFGKCYRKIWIIHDIINAYE